MEVALPAIPVVLIALIALIVAFIFYPTLKALVTPLLAVQPFGIGDWVGRQVDALIGAAYRTVAPWAQAQIGFASQLILAPYNYVSRLFHWSVLIDQAMAINLYALVAIRIPQAYVDLSRLTYTVRDQVLSYTLGWANALQALTYTVRDQVLSYALGLYGLATQLTYTIRDQVLSYALGLYGLATQLTYTVRDQVLGYVDGTAAADRAYAEALQRQALGYAQEGIQDALGAAERARAEAEAYAQAAAGQALRYADQVRAQAIAHADALAVPLAAAVTALEDSPCIKACEPLGEIGQLIQDLEGAGLLALLLALVEEARTHPDQVTAMLGEVFTGPAHEGLTSVVR